jgi:PIN domain nuclease of toxin-antitoxin system
MRLLLDTHTFLWSISAPHKLPKNARKEIEDKQNQAYVSAVTFWEIAIKVRLGKLTLGSDENVVDAAISAGFLPIPLTPEEAASSSDLAENTHTDPFDRLLVWQAITRDLTMVSGDAEFRLFKLDGLKLLWK